MADLFSYLTEEVIESITRISHTLEEQHFDGTIEISSQQFVINETNGQQYAYAIHHSANQQQIRSYERINEITTEILNDGDIHPVPPVYQLNYNLEWKFQVIRVIKDIIGDNNLNATQLQKYYQLGRLYQNVPNEHRRRLTALKFDLEKKCKTRTMDTHLRIARRTWQIFNKIGLKRLERDINVTPFQIGRLVNDEFEKVLRSI